MHFLTDTISSLGHGARASLVKVLRSQASDLGDRRAFTFVSGDDLCEDPLTYVALDARARRIAAALQELRASGQRAVLLYPPGLDFVAALFGCLYASVTAVPAYPPDASRARRTVPRLSSIARDAQAKLILTTREVLAWKEALVELAPELGALTWLATDDIPPGREDAWSEPTIRTDDLAIIQYTSGSTDAPRGVMVTHDNVLENGRMIRRTFGTTPESIIVSWLPTYHDMGLIGIILQVVCLGAYAVIMSPLDFLRRPVLWLRAITKYRAGFGGGPNFGYELCARKISPRDLSDLDLSSWEVAFCGSEPVRASALARFAETFRACGFRSSSYRVCYGLAEATLLVSGARRGGLVTKDVDAPGLSKGIVSEARSQGHSATLVGCGQPSEGGEVIVVDPETRRRCAPGSVGELWISGPHVGMGYWNRPEETAARFSARLADTDTGARPYLRTGDLGFLHEEELFVAGRIKDVIIVRGRNYYPQDIEHLVEEAHPALRPGCSAAFSMDVDGAEHVAVAVERRTDWQGQRPEEVFAAIRSAVSEALDLPLYRIYLLASGTIPKTSSGKIQRRACRQAVLDGALEIVAQSAEDRRLEDLDPVREGEPAGTPAGGPGRLHRTLLECPPEKRQATIEAFLHDRIGTALGTLAAQSPLPPEAPLSSLGIDSLRWVELKSHIEDALGTTLPAALPWEQRTLSAAASFLLAHWLCALVSGPDGPVSTRTAGSADEGEEFSA